VVNELLLKIKVGAEGGDDEGFILKVIDGYYAAAGHGICHRQYCEILILHYRREIVFRTHDLTAYCGVHFLGGQQFHHVLLAANVQLEGGVGVDGGVFLDYLRHHVAGGAGEKSQTYKLFFLHAYKFQLTVHPLLVLNELMK